MKTKLIALIEVGSVFVFSSLVIWTWSTTSWAGWQQQQLYWNYFSHVFYIILTLLIIIVAKRNLTTYGLTLKNWGFGVRWGLVFALILDGSLILAVLFFGDFKWTENILSTIIFQLLIVSFSEEFLFRGYFQSRLNEVFEKKLHFKGFIFGWGLIITSFLFGFAHLLNPFNPLVGQFALDWPVGVMTIIYGFFFGLMREKTGSILMPAIVHGALFVSYLFPTPPIGFAVAWLINGILLFRVFGYASTTY